MKWRAKSSCDSQISVAKSIIYYINCDERLNGIFEIEQSGINSHLMKFGGVMQQ